MANKQSSIEIESINVRAIAGTHISLCVMDSCKLAFDKRINVLFRHNDNLYKIDVTTVYESIFNQHERH